MGVIVTLRPNLASGNWAWAWIAAFAVAGFLTARGTEISERVMEAKITGGDSFPLFLVSGPWPNEQFQLYVGDNGDTLFDVSFAVRRILGYPHPTEQEAEKSLTPIAKAGPVTIYRGGNLTEVWLQPGYYVINAVARNGRFSEGLEIPQPGQGRLKWSLTRDGTGELLSCSPMPQCKGLATSPPLDPSFAPAL